MAIVYEYSKTADIVENCPDNWDTPIENAVAVLAEAYPPTPESEHGFDDSEHPDDPTFVICQKDYEMDIVRQFTIHLPDADTAYRLAGALDGWVED